MTRLLEVIGVVADEQETLGQPRTQMYVVYNQDPGTDVNLLVRAKSDFPNLAEKLKAEIRALDNQVIISRVTNR